MWLQPACLKSMLSQPFKSHTHSSKPHFLARTVGGWAVSHILLLFFFLIVEVIHHIGYCRCSDWWWLNLLLISFYLIRVINVIWVSPYKINMRLVAFKRMGLICSVYLQNVSVVHWYVCGCVQAHPVSLHNVMSRQVNTVNGKTSVYVLPILHLHLFIYKTLLSKRLTNKMSMRNA